MKKVLIYLLFGLLLLFFSLTVFVALTMGIVTFANAETTKDIFVGLLSFVVTFLQICYLGKTGYDSCKKTCQGENCGKVFRTDKARAKFCPECKKLKKAEDNRKRNAEVRRVKIKPRAENKYERETDALFAFVRRVDRYNKEHGTRYSYGQFEDAVHNRKIKIVG